MPKLNRHPIFVATLLTVALWTFRPSTAGAQSAVATDKVDGQLYYVSSGGASLMINVAPGVSPDGVIFGPAERIYYTLYGSGQVAVFNPFNRSNTVVTNGLDHPTDLLLEPGCQNLLVSVQGLSTGKTGLARILLATGGATLVPLSFTPAGLAYDSQGRLFVADQSGETVHQVDPFSGAILNSLPFPLMSPNNQPDVPDGMTFDRFTLQLFITSDTYGGIYEIPTDLSGYSFVAAVPPPAGGVVSDGAGNVFAASHDTHIYQYSIPLNTLTQRIAVPGLADMAIVPTLGCSKGTSNCKNGEAVE